MGVEGAEEDGDEGGGDIGVGAEEIAQYEIHHFAGVLEVSDCKAFPKEVGQLEIEGVGGCPVEADLFDCPLQIEAAGSVHEIEVFHG